MLAALRSVMSQRIARTIFHILTIVCNFRIRYIELIESYILHRINFFLTVL